MPLMDYFEPPERELESRSMKDLDLDTEYLRDPTKRHVMKVSERDCTSWCCTINERFVYSYLYLLINVVC